MGWGPNKIHYFIKFRFEHTKNIHHIENELIEKFKYDKFWEVEYYKDRLPEFGQPLPPEFQGKSIIEVK